MKNIFSNKYFRYGIFVLAGLILGRLLFHTPHSNEGKQQTVQNDKHTIWTCAMHPQIRMEHPGKCPICGMDLIPLGQSGDTTIIDPNAIQLTKEAAQLANVQTSVVQIQKPVKEIRLYGKVQSDERLLQTQVSHMPGRIEKLLVNFTGESVRKGQPLAIIYSPELVTAQQELLEAARMKQSQPEIYEAAKDRLRQWKLTDNQISDIENSGKVKDNFEIVSNTNGVIIGRRINNGDHVDAGTILFDVSDLSHVWVLFDAYETDLLFLNIGDWLSFTVQALPGYNFRGKIIFIDPVIDPVTRVAKVRVDINNEPGKLKPEMFVTGIVNADLNQYRNKLVIPGSAVLWTGTRSIVYVKQPGVEEPTFKMREIELGPSLGNSYVVIGVLNEGEEIVTQGAFSVDASAQLQGKPSMMNPQGGATNTMPGMDMSENKSQKTTQQKQQPKEGAGNEMQGMPGMSQTSSKSDVSMDFVMQLNNVVDKYLALKNSFVQSDVKKVKDAAQKTTQALTKVDMKLLSGDDHMKWMDMLDQMNKQLGTIASIESIDNQRKTFSSLTQPLYNAIKKFGLMEKTLYYQFCPMYNNGSYWLSESKDIKNPFYGEAMLTCGETKETLKY